MTCLFSYAFAHHSANIGGETTTTNYQYINVMKQSILHTTFRRLLEKYEKG